MNTVQSIVLEAWTRSRKTRISPKGWHSGDAVCCVHTGESQDKRGRGGVIISPDGGVSYSCFNCGFKSSWRPGWYIPFTMRRLLSWLNASEAEIRTAVLDSLRIREEVGPVELDRPERKIEFKPHDLPEDALPIGDWANYADELPDDFHDVVKYLGKRGLTIPETMKMWWTPTEVSKTTKMNRRFIIPFTWENKLIGYTARSIDSRKDLKYYSEYDSDFVYNVDGQVPKAEFVIAVEGPMDARVINGVGLLGNEVSDVKAEIVERLNRRVIVVPDKGAPGQKLVDVALDYGWDVSFPQWAHSDVDDVNKAVQRYGRLFTMSHILNHTQSSKLKIELLRKKY